ncbi:FadR/GntR family transcriptional regulator [Donghicola tyrosinivorans]|uniref:DNA-binding FadR family transcriptional regulator n=1 Tax=Donghicola tyrosinivorans TaxID=1652492 RepID=A0A2T0WEK4_9RHOB|nr:FadR/GntR family transcriptional regulator [Donghicola tyrosinivorans]PRY85085.1 DNA-binding FadR family transcriptional regulator [Donghicola tyrosinivorans]
MIRDKFPDTGRFPRPVRSLHAEVVEEIARWLIVGDFTEGDVLPNEQEVGQALGVSRTVVREAVRTLVAKGMLQVRRRTGTVVLSEDEWNIFDTEVLAWRFRYGVSNDFLEELFKFRAGTETIAAELCATNPDFDVAELRDCCDAMERALDGQGDWFEADLRFHRLLLTGAGNRFLAHIVPMLENLFDALLSPDVLIEENMRRTLPRHRAVVDAIASGNTTQVREAMLLLVSEAREDTLRRIGDAGGAE